MTSSRPLFNSPLEIGLRSAAILAEAYPEQLDIQQLVILDYFVVHSDDLPAGPPGLHPQTPHRGGELLVRREVIQDGLKLYASRNLVEQHYSPAGRRYSATESTAALLDSLHASYAGRLRERAQWAWNEFGRASLADLQRIVAEHLGEWGAEFEYESVLWEEPEE